MRKVRATASAAATIRAYKKKQKTTSFKKKRDFVFIFA
jgi:hypothetical protein